MKECNKSMLAIIILCHFGALLCRLGQVVQCETQQQNHTAKQEKGAQACTLREVWQWKGQDINRKWYCRVNKNIDQQKPCTKALTKALISRCTKKLKYIMLVRSPDNITTREETTAEEIFISLSIDILKAILVAIYSSGSNGAPLQPEARNILSDKQNSRRAIFIKFTRNENLVSYNSFHKHQKCCCFMSKLNG